MRVVILIAALKLSIDPLTTWMNNATVFIREYFGEGIHIYTVKM